VGAPANLTLFRIAAKLAAALYRRLLPTIRKFKVVPGNPKSAPNSLFRTNVQISTPPFHPNNRVLHNTSQYIARVLPQNAQYIGGACGILPYTPSRCQALSVFNPRVLRIQVADPSRQNVAPKQRQARDKGAHSGSINTVDNGMDGSIFPERIERKIPVERLFGLQGHESMLEILICGVSKRLIRGHEVSAQRGTLEAKIPK